MHKLLLASLLLVSSSSLALAQTPAPPATDSAHTAAKAKPSIYDEKASGDELINAALAKATKNNRRVLIQWGGNWCPWCHLLHEAMSTDKDLKHELLYEYDVVLVDVGRFDRNMDVAAKYGADLKASGVPFITILDSTGKVLANQETGSLESKEEGKHEHDRAAVLKFLKQHEATPRQADQVLKTALSKAGADGKRVFLHFGAPWCGWCHKLENWMARPDIAPLLDKAFIDVKLDMDRDAGSPAVMSSVGGKPDGGIPWFVILDAEGKVLATSDAPGSGNVGFPAAPAEVDHFVSMLRAAKTNLSAGDIQTLATTLREKAPPAH